MHQNTAADGNYAVLKTITFFRYFFSFRFQSISLKKKEWLMTDYSENYNITR